jgi:hypothetical protein
MGFIRLNLKVRGKHGMWLEWVKHVCFKMFTGKTKRKYTFRKA